MIAGPKNRQLDKKYVCATVCASYALSFAHIISGGVGKGGRWFA